MSYSFLPLFAYQREGADASISQPQLSEKTCINCVKPRVSKNILQNAAERQIYGNGSNFTVKKKQGWKKIRLIQVKRSDCGNNTILSKKPT